MDIIQQRSERAGSAAVDLVLATGGLGPTHDDLTREGLADALDEPLTPDPALEEQLRERFGRIGRMPPSNLRQALRISLGRGAGQPHRLRTGLVGRTRWARDRADARRAVRDATHVRRTGDAAAGRAVRRDAVGGPHGQDLRDRRVGAGGDAGHAARGAGRRGDGRHLRAGRRRAPALHDPGSTF